MKAERWMVLSVSIAVLVVASLVVMRYCSTRSTQVATQLQPEQIGASLVFPASMFTTPITTSQQVDAIVTLPPNLFSRSPEKPDSSQVIAVVLTGVFTLFGSSIVLIYNYLSSTSARKFEWGKHLWDEYQEDYLRLRNTVRETLDPEMINNALDALGTQVILPPKLEHELLELVALLRTSTPRENKEHARKAFLKAFENFIARPWTYL